jgi:soluble lytic murein transglycosylase-like protein
MFADLTYVARVLRSVWRPRATWRRAAATAPALAVAAIGAVAAYGYVPAVSAAEQDEVAGLQVRAERVSVALREVEALYESQVAPLERVLRSYRDDPVLARRVAVALVREGRGAGVPAHLLLAVLLVENPWVNPAAVSPVGARGLMQVMPLHRGKWRPCPPVLDDIDANICHGARIFAGYLKQQDGNVERALLRYNGCVNGTNTPNCSQYANHVFARFGRASVLAMDGE